MGVVWVQTSKGPPPPLDWVAIFSLLGRRENPLRPCLITHGRGGTTASRNPCSLAARRASRGEEAGTLDPRVPRRSRMRCMCACVWTHPVCVHTVTRVFGVGLLAVEVCRAVAGLADVSC